MLTESERKILDIIAAQQLITKGELKIKLGKENGGDVGLQRLKEMGYIDTVESLGNCFVITQSGLRAVQAAKF